MIIVKLYNSLNRDEWDAFIDASKMPMFMFKRGFMDYHSDRFQDNSLMFYEDDELIALLPASRHGEEMRSHGGLTYGGFITNDKMKQHRMIECFEVLQNYLKQNGFKRMIYKIIPYIFCNAAAQEDLYPLFFKAKLCRRDISSTIFLKNPLNMPKGRKAQISRAKREGVVIEKSDDFDTFIELENAILSEYHDTKAVHTAAELRLLKSRFPDEIELWCAMYQGKMIAAALLFIYPEVVHTQYLAADATAREIGGLDYLIKALIDLYKDKKSYFDFGISTEQGCRIFNEGLCAQKEGFGARTVVYDFYEWNIQ